MLFQRQRKQKPGGEGTLHVSRAAVPIKPCFPIQLSIGVDPTTNLASKLNRTETIRAKQVWGDALTFSVETSASFPSPLSTCNAKPISTRPKLNLGNPKMLKNIWATCVQPFGTCLHKRNENRPRNTRAPTRSTHRHT